MRIILTGGGTGGHIFPLIAVMKQVKDLAGLENLELLYVGSGAKIEKEVMSSEGVPVVNIMSGKIRRYFSLLNFIDFFKVPIGIIQSLWILLRFMPDAVFSKGGYAAVPVVIAAWIYRIPVLIHESDAIAGLANKFSAKFARRIGVAYDSAKQYFPEKKTAVIGNPVREDIMGGNRSEALSLLKLSESKPVIFVMGGSQGSNSINEAIIKALPELLKKVQIIHQTGKDNYENVVHEAAEYGIKAGREGYLAFPFMDPETLKDSFAAADLVISRAGANSISEIAANRKPSILIPLETSANNHQRANALDVAHVGGAIVLEEMNLTKHLLIQAIDKILNEKEFADSLSEKISVFYHPDAAKIIASGVLEMI